MRRPLELPISTASLTLARSIWSGQWQTSWTTQTETGDAGDLDRSYRCEVDRPGPLFLDRRLEVMISRLRSWAWSLDAVEAY